MTAVAADAAPRPAWTAGRAVRLWLAGWPAVVQLVLDLALAVPYLVLSVLFVVSVVLVPVFGVGVLGLLLTLGLARACAALDRARVLAFADRHVPPPPEPPRDQPAWRRLLLDGRPWKAAAHVVAVVFWGLTGGLAMLVALSTGIALALLPAYQGALPNGRLDLFGLGTVPGGWWWGLVGVLTLAVLPFAALALVRVDVALAQWLLGPTRTQREQILRRRVETLTRTRVDTVDSVEAERRRIERDLHDGPQQRLVAIAMDLGLARQRLAEDPERARELLDHAHAAVKEAITEMRQVARGIHPPVLTDRGLDAALSALAAGTPIPVHVSVDVPERPSPTLESIAYFCVSEALTNVAKHAQARQAWVDVRRQDGRLVARVTDDGVGGADLTRGTGLVGLRQRAAAVDGTVDVSSPPDGPTVVTVSLPDLPSGLHERRTTP
ncbi:MAG TPA: sensor histidine kinase [Kineosporiaceae bacterium]|nr:sensor histidine kinase [Kineosporiaceae bacterium]